MPRTTTDKCYRLAVKPGHGVGIVEWGIGGDMPFPEAYTGAVKGYDADSQAISLVLDFSSGQFYRIGQNKVWQDKIGSYGQGVEINSMVRFKEHISGDNEESMLEHVETRMVMRPYDEDYKGQSGHTDAGFRENHNVSLKMFADGDTDNPVSKLKYVHQYGDYVHGERVEAKRLQHQVEMSTAAYRITRVRQLLQNINKVTPDEVGGIRTENLYQRMFRGQDLWISRDSVTPLMNRATGTAATGSYSSLVTGPDSKSNSAIALLDTSDIEASLSQLSLPNTLSFWAGDLISEGFTFSFEDLSGNDFDIKVSKSTTVIVTFSHLAWEESVELAWDGNDWALITISSDGLDLFVYENGVLKGIVTSPISSYGGTLNIVGNTMGSVFDIRRIPRQIKSEALQWYYDDVVNNEGDGGLLPVMR